MPLTLQSSSLCFEESILDWAHGIGREDWPWINRSRHTLLPRLQHALHVSPSIAIDECVGVHENAVEVATQVDCVWRADVLDDAV
jgi:hypothetical protein